MIQKTPEGVPEDLSTVSSQILISARHMFTLLHTVVNEQELPTADQKDNADSLQNEIDKIDVELISRGLSPFGDEC